MLGIETVHQERIHHEQHYKADDRALLRHPETEGRIADLRRIGIKPFTKYDPATKAN